MFQFLTYSKVNIAGLVAEIEQSVQRGTSKYMYRERIIFTRYIESSRDGMRKLGIESVSRAKERNKERERGEDKREYDRARVWQRGIDPCAHLPTSLFILLPS